MKFLHTSDWHLGRQFHNVSLLGDQRIVLSQIIDYISDHGIDALIIAGDIYDRSVPPASAIEVLNEFVEVVCGQLNTPIIMISGNHDGAERLSFASQHMKSAGLHIIGRYQDMLTPVILTSTTAGEVAFYGMPYHDPEHIRSHFGADVSTHDEAHQYVCQKILSHIHSLTFETDTDSTSTSTSTSSSTSASFNPSLPHKSECKNVLLSHCFIDGAEESDSERPLSIGGSDRVSYQHFEAFDYVALGHLHQAQQRGKEYIRYSGSMMKYSFSEQHHKKGMTLVELDHDGFVSAQAIPLVSPKNMRVIEGTMQEVLDNGKQDKHHLDYVLVRLLDTHAILDPMEKLRAVYPNILHLEKPGML
ncbi:exonuclease SbcCD subunit D, partial [Vibrio sp.]|nr:exonuclease SbcCD subunit D [Vibrio sp.]